MYLADEPHAHAPHTGDDPSADAGVCPPQRPDDIGHAQAVNAEADEAARGRHHNERNVCPRVAVGQQLQQGDQHAAELTQQQQ